MFKKSILYIAALFLVIFSTPALAIERLGVEFKIFQFPANAIPRIDGKADDWEMVTKEYSIGMDQLSDTVGGRGTKIDRKDKDVNVRVGWVKGLNRLYFLYEAYDDFWDFNKTDLHNDIFELVVDGDLSGGPLIKQMHPVFKTEQGRGPLPLSWCARAELPHLYAQRRQGLGDGLGLPTVDQGDALGERCVRLQLQTRAKRQVDAGILDYAV